MPVDSLPLVSAACTSWDNEGCGDQKTVGTKPALFVLTSSPRHGPDKIRKALRLIAQMQGEGVAVQVFLMNHAVFLAYERLKSKEEYELQKTLLETISKGAKVGVCKPFIVCGGKGCIRLRPEMEVLDMRELLKSLEDSDQVLVF